MRHETQFSGTSPVHDHDRRDVQVKGILIFAIFLALFTLAWMVGVGIMLRGYSAQERSTQLSRPERFADRTDLYPDPRLQGNPAADTARMRIDDARWLSSYGWVNEKKGIARVPLDRAMKLVADRGLPTRGATPKEPRLPRDVFAH